MEFSAYTEAVRAIYKRIGVPWTSVLGCSAPAITAAETEIGFPLHPALRAAWMIADGSGATSIFTQPALEEPYTFLSIAAALDMRESFSGIASNYAGYEEPEPRDTRMRDGWFLEGWLPFANFGGGTLMLILDYTPSESGQAGQVIAFTHDPDEITYVAQDLPTFLGLSLQTIMEHPEKFVGIGY